jgi:hypothetical protein
MIASEALGSSGGDTMGHAALLVLLLAATAVDAVAGSVALTRGPYLMMGSSDAVTIRWRTDVPSSSRVWLGARPGALHVAATDATLMTEHELRVTGLLPDARAYYAIGTGTEVLAGDDSLTWYDAAPSADRSIRVWVLGDSGKPGVRQDRVRDAYYGLPGAARTDVWLMLGDNAYETGTDDEYQAAVFAPYASFLRTHVLWPTRGNHDVLHSGAGNDYYDVFTMPDAAQAGGLPSGTEAWYSFDAGDVHFVCLDSEGSDRGPGSAQLTWLEADLAATTRKWIVAFWHHPPYTKGSHDSDPPSRMQEMRENAMPILEAGGVDLVLGGHSHVYERSFLIDGHYGLSTTFVPSMKKDPGDGRLLGDGPYRKPTVRTGHAGEVVAVAGASSQASTGPLDHPAMAYALAALGSLVLDVGADTLRGRYLDDLGLVRDDFAIVKPHQVVSAGGPTFGIALAGANPARGKVDFVVAGVDERADLAIVDAKGRLLRRVPVAGDRAEWDASGTVPGVYFAVLRQGGARRVARIVIAP